MHGLCICRYGNPPARLGVRRWPHPPPPLLTSLAWRDPQTVAWSHLRKRRERERVPGCIVKHFSFLLHGSQIQPAFYLLIVFLYITITKQLDPYLLIFSWDLFTGGRGERESPWLHCEALFLSTSWFPDTACFLPPDCVSIHYNHKTISSYFLTFSWDLFTGVSGYQRLKMKPNGS